MIFGFFYIFKGEGEISVKHFQSAIRYIEEVNFVHLFGAIRAGLGWGYHLSGKNIHARKHLEKSLDIQLGAGISNFLTTARIG